MKSIAASIVILSGTFMFNMDWPLRNDPHAWIGSFLGAGLIVLGLVKLFIADRQS